MDATVKMTWAEFNALPDVEKESWRNPARYRILRRDVTRWRWYLAENELFEDPQHGHAMYRTRYFRIIIRLEVS
jgi:hypothetical protein